MHNKLTHKSIRKKTKTAQFTKEDIQIHHKHLKKCPDSVIFKEMQVEIKKYNFLVH